MSNTQLVTYLIRTRYITATIVSTNFIHNITKAIEAQGIDPSKVISIEPIGLSK